MLCRWSFSNLPGSILKGFGPILFFVFEFLFYGNFTYFPYFPISPYFPIWSFFDETIAEILICFDDLGIISGPLGNDSGNNFEAFSHNFGIDF